jgi:hypothetical protein
LVTTIAYQYSTEPVCFNMAGCVFLIKIICHTRNWLSPGILFKGAASLNYDYEVLHPLYDMIANWLPQLQFLFCPGDRHFSIRISIIGTFQSFLSSRYHHLLLGIYNEVYSYWLSDWFLLFSILISSFFIFRSALCSKQFGIYFSSADLCGWQQGMLKRAIKSLHKNKFR